MIAYQKSLERYPLIEVNEPKELTVRREGFEEGYSQALKENGLIWQDVSKIIEIFLEVDDEIKDACIAVTNETISQIVFDKFKAYKEAKK